MNERTAAQRTNAIDHRDRIHESVVPKSLREQAIELIKTLPPGEARTHAYGWVRFRGRKRSEIESFITKVSGR